MSKLCKIGLLMIIFLHHSKLHMLEICGKTRCIYATHNYSAKFHTFCLKKVLHILIKFSAINQHPCLVTHWL